ncbi:sugar ABC transporter substrate-binding protein [Paenarthrobacter sp. YIM B13468]|uniref:sugar ABC transporter substrate-binding protein n=1 Tax=Paenarthrobacter sp. YIM B13468 TaxID=3366295 RepID=UPI00366D3989
MRKQPKFTLGLGIALVITLAACSAQSGGSGPDTAGSATPSALSADVPTTEPSSIPMTEPLKERPEPGKKVIVQYCSAPTCARFNQGFEDAAKALGWTVETMVYDTNDMSASLRSAVVRHPDFIVTSGQPREALEAGLKDAHKAGIPVFVNSTDIQTDESAGLYAGVNMAPTTERSAEYLADWMMADSGSTANAVYFYLGDRPVQQASAAALKNRFAECAKCSLNLHSISLEEIGRGAVPASVVAFVQAHPEVKYVAFSFGDAATGVGAALASVGLADRLKLIVDGTTSPAVTQEMVHGTVSMMLPQAAHYMGWASVNQMARYAAGLPQPSEEERLMPAWVVETPEAAQTLIPKGGLWPGPSGFEEQFKKIWHVQ